MRWLTTPIRCLAIGSLAVVLLCWLFLYADSICQRRKAERLLSSLRTFPFSTANFNQVRDFTLQHEGSVLRTELPPDRDSCSPQHCDFEVSVNTTLIKFARHVPSYGHQLDLTANYLGINPWVVATTFEVRNGRLAHSRTIIGAERLGEKQDSFGGTVYMQYQVDTVRVSIPYAGTEHPDYFITTPHVTGPPTELLQVWTVQSASQPLRQAFDVRLGCVTSLGGCSSLRQFVPLTWSNLTNSER